MEKAAADFKGGCLISLKVIPRSSRDQIVGTEQGALKLKLQAPPVEGAANEAVLEFFSKCLRRPKSTLKLVAGHRSRHKRLMIQGMKASEVLGLLNQNVKGKSNG